MFTVTINSENRKSSYEQFEREFFKICNEHRENNRALVFAFILYDFENEHIGKILEDPHYWLSLNSISGEYLTVFSLHYKAEDMKSKLMDIMKQRMNQGTQKEFNMIPTDQNPSQDTNKLIQKYFGKDFKIKYPSVLFFQVKENAVSDSRLIQLDQEGIEASFLELKQYIKIAAEALQEVNREYKHNVDELFSLVDQSVSGLRQKIQIKKGIKTVTSLAELAATVTGLNPS
ncbi:hypothetical protein [Flavobacterium sp. ZB4R12]|uniref:hypothetical protein n=1 Tax=Flavobacterium sp. ZB4R12 TaxID=3398732 RepID=UPI003AAF7D1A